MKKMALLVFLFIVFKPITSHSSEILANVEILTNLSAVVLVGKATSVEKKEFTLMNKVKETVEYKFDVSKVVKNSLGEDISSGKTFTFRTKLPVMMEVGSEYMIFLRKYSTGLYGFISGEQGIFKKGSDGGLTNKLNNIGLMSGMEKVVTGGNEVGAKTLSEKEARVLKQKSGSVGTEEMIKMIEQVDANKALENRTKGQ